MSRIPLKSAILTLCAAVLPPAMADEPGAHPGDDAMTCAQIAAELAPYMAQVRAPAEALNQTNTEIVARGKRRVAEDTPAAVGLTAAATAATVDPTGVSSRAVGQAEVAHQREVWARSQAEDKPLAEKQAAQANALMAVGQQMQNDPRLNRLMQLAQQKDCDKQQ
jgi:hypothetical protein